MSKFGAKSDPLSRGGLALSLVILRGALESLVQWADDVKPSMVETGVFRLAALRSGRVREIVSAADDEWPGHSFALQARVAQLSIEWATATPDARKWQLGGLIKLVNEWIADGEAVPS